MMENSRIRNVIVEDTDQINGLLNELECPNSPLPMKMWNLSERCGLWQ